MEKNLRFLAHLFQALASIINGVIALITAFQYYRGSHHSFEDDDY